MIRLLLAILILGGMSAQADQKIWSALVLASNPEAGTKAAEPPADLAPYAKRLSKVFKYQQFEILGSATKEMGMTQQERWLVPSPTFMVGVQAKPDGEEYRIQLELFQEKRRLIQTEAKLRMQSPLFICGPKHSRGQLIVVFEIRP
jgi:hypothetical protein